jgi:hypothetical protein
MQSSFASHVDKVRSLEGFIPEYDAIKREIGSFRERVEKTMTTKCSGDNVDGRNREEKSSVARLPKLETVEEEDEEQMAKQEEEERRLRRVELGRPRTTEPLSLGVSHFDD